MGEMFVPGAGRGVILGGNGGAPPPNSPLLATGYELRAVDVQGVPGIAFVFNRAGVAYPPMILALPPELLEQVPNQIWDLLDKLLPPYRKLDEEGAGEAPEV